MEEVIKVTVDDSGAVKDIDALREKLDSAKKKAESAGTEGIGSLKKQIRLLQQEMQGLDPASEKFIELSKRAGEFKDKIKDASEAINANAGPAIESFGNNVSLLKDRFVNLDFEGVAQSFKAVGSNVASIKFGDIIGGIKQMGSAFLSVGKALLTNPIFLIGATIAAAIVYAEDLLKLVDGVSDSESERAEIAKQNVVAQENALNAISEQENVLKLQGKSERDILQMKIAQGKQAIEAAQISLEQQKQLRQQQIEAAQRNKTILSGLIQFITAPLQLLLEGFDQLTQKARDWGVISEETYSNIGNLRDKFNDTVSSLVFDPEQVAADGQATVDEAQKTLDKLRNQQAGFQLQVQAIDKAASDKKKSDREKALEEQQKADEAELERRKKLQGEFEKIESKGLEVSKRSKEELFAQSVEADKKRIEQEKNYLANKQKLAEKDAERQKEIKAAEVQTASNTIGSLIALNEAFGTQNGKLSKAAFERGKKLQIAQALIQTYQSATAAYSSQAAIPVVGPVLGGIAAAAAIASGIAQIKKIQSTTYESPQVSTSTTANTGGGSVNQGGNPTPSLSLPNLNQAKQEPMRSYVIATDITRTTEAQNNIRKQTELGG
jgi:hypothetical protein